MQVIALVHFLLFWLAVLGWSILVGLIFAGITAILIKGVAWQQRLRMSAISAAPFALIAVVIASFVLRGADEQKLNFPGRCPLANGYMLMMADGTTPGWIYKLRDQSERSSVNWQQDGVDGVLRLQTTSRYILGARDSRGLSGGGRTPEVDSYFILDTDTDKLTKLPSLAALQDAASKLGFQTKLQSVHGAYQRYRMPYTSSMPIGVPLASIVLAALLVRWVLQIRRFRVTPSSGEQS